MADIDQAVLNAVVRKWLEQEDSSHAPVGATVMAPIYTKTVTIANGASLSDAADLKNGRLAGIVIPAAWTTANLTFQTSPDGVTYYDRYDNFGGEYGVVVGGASRSILVPVIDWLGVRFLKVRSGTTGSAVNQGGARILTLLVVR